MLRLSDLTAGYGAFTAVHGLSLEIAPASVFALVGANGAGKSSTIMAIAGHVAVQGGTVELDGEDITALPVARRVSRGIALAPEGRRLFGDMSVRENLMIGGYARPARDEAQNRARVIELFPRLGERLDQAAGTLSGGEQQMLLMPAAVDVCYAAIHRLKEAGISILLVEQSTVRALEIADAVCVLESGHAVWQGSAEAARKDPAMIEAYMGLSANQA
jgi:branched-chain amino acid transport system ATP-binding protein